MKGRKSRNYVLLILGTFYMKIPSFYHPVRISSVVYLEINNIICE
jgi:hypothetical protein